MDIYLLDTSVSGVVVGRYVGRGRTAVEIHLLWWEEWCKH